MLVTKHCRNPRHLIKRPMRSFAALALLCLTVLETSQPAGAIPSPELIVGSLSGLSQLGALIAAMLGGGTGLAMRGAARRAAGRREDPAATRKAYRLLLGVMALAALLAGCSVWQWVSSESDRQVRLTATLTRPPRAGGEPGRDASLKELSFAEQTRHALAITTADAAKLLAEPDASGVAVLDIRESAEVEMGTFPNATAVRFPDVDAAQLARDGRRLLLICHNGNRSSETCQALAAQGIDCRFIAGGLEKWITEGRRIGDFYRRSLKEVRAIPAYRNQDRLLDTREVHDLVANEQVQFVDVRYPGEFASGHLAGAINIPMRRLSSQSLAAALAALPNRPVVVPCYDRRSCFFGELLGLELTRSNRDFRGRYTQPWEYFITSSPPPHVAAYLAEESKGVWAKAQDLLVQVIAAGADAYGLLAVIAALALLSRLLVLPFSLKAERDQITAQHITPQVAALKARLADDPARLARALREIYARTGLTPARNQIALLMLPILALNVEAVGRVASLHREGFAWLDDLAPPDPLYLLPLCFGIFFAAYIHWALARTRRGIALTWCLAAPLLAVAGANLPAAAALYLAFSATLLLVQRAVVVGIPSRAAELMAQRLRLARPLPKGVLTLADAAQRPDTGNKAHRLGILASHGIPVPLGVVLSSKALAAWRTADAAARRTVAAALWRKIGRGRVAVRSSAAGEDGAAASFAGVFESVLDIDKAHLPGAIDQVLASFDAARSASYGTAGQPNILIQRMVDAEFAGVLFTRAPDAVGLSLVEMVEGTADGLVSGTANPRTYRFGRLSGVAVSAGPCPIDLTPLLALGRRIEEIFEGPQDIEWTFVRGRFQIVQSRDITAIADMADLALEPEWCRVLAVARDGAADNTVLARNELCELLPRPSTLSLSLLAALHDSGGSADLACRSLGLSYGASEFSPPQLLCIFGRLHVDLREAAQRAPRLSRLDARRLRHQLAEIERAFEADFLPAFATEMALLEALHFDRIPAAELTKLAARLRESFIARTHVEAEIINIAAEFASAEARSAIKTVQSHRAIDDADIAALLVPDRTTAFADALQRATSIGGDAGQAVLLREIGHRSRLDYELAEPRYSEAPDVLTQLLKVPPHTERRQAQKLLRKLPDDIRPTVERARRFLTLKEDAKHAVLRELAVLRHVLLALDHKFEFCGHIFNLTLDEALSLAAETCASHAETAQMRANERTLLQAQPALPSRLSLHDLELASWRGRPRHDGHAVGGLAGTRVAGRRAAEGRAYVVSMATAETGGPLPGFAADDILVTPMVHPAWLPEVVRAAGVVSDTGGFLSHMAIVARERDVAMIVGVADVMTIVHGSWLRLGIDGQIETLSATTTPEMQPLAAE